MTSLGDPVCIAAFRHRNFEMLRELLGANKKHGTMFMVDRNKYTLLHLALMEVLLFSFNEILMSFSLIHCGRIAGTRFFFFFFF